MEAEEFVRRLCAPRGYGGDERVYMQALTHYGPTHYGPTYHGPTYHGPTCYGPAHGDPTYHGPTHYEPTHHTYYLFYLPWSASTCGRTRPLVLLPITWPRHPSGAAQP
eukprot:scaffold45417_cov51-Phaeocystis_antarctica.AAC.1